MDHLVEIRLTPPQFKLIESIVAIPDDLEKALKRAAKENPGPRLRVPYVDLDQLAGWLAAEANYEEGVRRKRSLDKLYDEVQTALWDFEDRTLADGGPMPVAPAESIPEADLMKPKTRKRAPRKKKAKAKAKAKVKAKVKAKGKKK
jgi:hypothetical protein